MCSVASVVPDLLQTHGQRSLFMGFSWQEYWSRLPFPPPGDLLDPGVEPMSPASPVLQVDSLPLIRGSPVGA